MLNHLFSSELFQVVGGMTGAILRFILLPHSADLLGELKCGKATRKRRQRQDRFYYPTYPWSVEIDASHLSLPYLRGRRQLFQSGIAEKALVHATQRVHKSFQNALQLCHNLRKFLQTASTGKFLDVRAMSSCPPQKIGCRT